MTAPPPAAAAPAEFPHLRLQAIYFRLKDPSVVINGHTAQVGDRVEGARVVAIERSRVEVEFQGERRTMELQ
jgi:hypothetical protein